MPATNLAVLDTSVYIENFRSARDSGATLITCNREDFTEVREHLAFKVIFW